MQGIVKRVAYHLQSYEIVKGKILAGELKRGERINESQLAQELGISKIPIREALRMLEQDELLVSRSEGLMVNPLEFADMKEIYETRIMLESYAAGIGCGYITPEEVQLLEDCVEASRRFHHAGDAAKVVESNTQFHDLILRACPNQHLKKIIDRNRSLSIIARVGEFLAYQRDDGYLDEHSAIVEAIRQKDAGRTEKMMREHISNDLAFYIHMNRQGGCEQP